MSTKSSKKSVGKTSKQGSKSGITKGTKGVATTSSAPGSVGPTTDLKSLSKDLKPEESMKFFRDMFRFHGDRPRGADFFPKSSLFEGRFGRMFRTLPSAQFQEDDLKALATAMVAEEEVEENDNVDPEENQGIDAGYTYWGQFIDHDLTFDPASSLQKQNDPDALVDFRTPRFDLDNVYGRGPDDQPYLYEDNGVRLLLGRKVTGNAQDPQTRDVPRNTNPGGRARALIGDPRNDENVIVSQLQATILRFHNRMVKFLPTMPGNGALLSDPKKLFEEAQRQVRFHYQWAVVNDFLPTVAGQGVVDSILPHLKRGTNITVDKPDLSLFRWEKEPYIPIEFSAAAYRFGHSMVRPSYRLNTTLPNRFAIFGPNELTSLTGFREFPSSWAVDWSLYFPIRPTAPTEGKARLQRSYKIDTSLVNPLGHLPSVIVANVPSLAERNLIRGLRMGLPSGQDVARAMHLPVIPDEKLKVGKATAEDHDANPLLTSISPRFAGKAPLWYYILAEAQQAFDGNDSTPIRLGPVGGRIVTSVFAGLLVGDKFSFLHDPGWRPIQAFTVGGKFGMVELIKQAMVAE
ncbi:MAG TPA: heme peroxidase family protein [Pyrinomonadaceae bacterium]|nr:heme peroxidase family protein [Pyrinomonadaceae bacterium]